MIRAIYLRVVVLSAVVVLTGCLKTRAELEAENSGTPPARQTQLQQREQAREVAKQSQAQVVAAPATNNSEEYYEQMRNINGKLESVEVQNRQLYDLMKAEREAAQQAKLADEQKLAAFEETLRKMESEVAKLNEENQKLKSSQSSKSPAVSTGGKAKTPYDEGEELFGERRFKEAIVVYQKYRDTYPKGRMYAESTYKIGVCFQELGMKDESKAFFEDVVVKFPKSKEAKKAAIRLKTIK